MASPEQQRVTDIASFREEIARLEREGIVLDPETHTRIFDHHQAILSSLAELGPVDLTPEAARLSTGMRIATLLGAGALSAAYGFFVASVWSRLAMTSQLLLVLLPPAILALLTHFAASRERSGYVASIIGTVSVIALWLGLVAVGSLYNLPNSRDLLLAVGVFGILLAYLYRLGLPLLVGIVAFGGWLWSLAAIPMGLFWTDAFLMVDPLVLLGVLFMLVPVVVRRPNGFAPIWRTAGALGFSVGVLTLSLNAALSMMDGGIDRPYIEMAYQVIAAIGLPALMVLGVRKEWFGVTVTAVVFFVIFLMSRLSAWFWDYLPRWLFFFLIGMLAVLVLLLLRQIRTRKAAA